MELASTGKGCWRLGLRGGTERRNMPKPKLTRKQLREQDEKAALRARLIDMLRGAHGDYDPPDLDPDDGSLSVELGMEAFGRWVGAIRQEWERPRDQPSVDGDGLVPSFLFIPGELHTFDTLDTAVERLYEHGARP
jgi:hypothetical protein